LDAAAPDGTDVYLFTCEGWRYKEYSSYEKGEYNIFNLPDLKQFDGVVVDLDTLHDESAFKTITRKVKEAQIPCVSFNIPLEDATTIHLENTRGIAAMAEHLVKVHGAKKIHFISGPLHSRDAKERKDAFFHTMEKLGLPCGEEDISYGDFEYRSGQTVIGQYLKKNRSLPDAFMAANDYMAAGAQQALQTAGYRIPQDVIVTGYDNRQAAKNSTPGITTIDRGEYEAGRLAYRNLVKKQQGIQTGESVTIAGKLVLSGSCGCREKSAADRAENLRGLAAWQMQADMNLELIKRAEIELSDMVSYDDFLRSTWKYIETVNLDYFYLCMCGNPDLYQEDLKSFVNGETPRRNYGTYPDTMWIPLAYEMGQWNRYDVFPTRDLLPANCKIQGNGNYFIVMPIHQSGYCMGYCVVGNYRDALDERFIQHLVLSMDNALGSMWKRDTMKGMYDRIKQKWLYDELTGIYNRSGLLKYADTLVAEAAASGGAVSAIFIDLDGLKKINDIHGHQAGDLYIKTMADTLKKCRKKGELLVRYGGDEYVIVSNQFTEPEILTYIESIRAAIEETNKESRFALSASIGYDIQKADETTRLLDIIKSADQKMYDEKTKKHCGRS
jgi:diguanylate cyclase (GGDEF)-like protein